jgi:murein DD-endopeptidase MepM/ murein hydrolase activator NlpD
MTPTTSSVVRAGRVLPGLLLLALAAATPAGAQSRLPKLLGESLLPHFGNLSRVGRMLVPVAGETPENLRDSFHDGRSGGRTHEAIDIPAARNTPVVAVTDGVVVGLRHEGLGGNAIHLLDPVRKRRYFYAHLDHFATGLEEGTPVRQGQVIGYVGDTGNAGRGNYHLHFAVIALDDVRHWWKGMTLDPYALLQDAAR